MPTSKPTGRRIRGLDAEQRKLQRRQALLDAALELFAQNGFVPTTIEQLCQAAYVGTKGFYETFESRDDLYAALLARITEEAFSRLAEVDAEVASADERTASRRILATFAHVFVDDVRVAKVTFGAGSAITPVAEQQRRANRRTAAAFVLSIWSRYAGEQDHAQHVAIGLIGGLFDIIADWLLDIGGEPSEDQIEELVLRLVAFYEAVRARHL